MITQTKVASGTRCGSSSLRRNGKTAAGKQNDACKDGGAHGSVNPTDRAYTDEEKAPILAAYHERTSRRGVERVLGVARQTLASWPEKTPTPSRPKKRSFSRV